MPITAAGSIRVPVIANTTTESQGDTSLNPNAKKGEGREHRTDNRRAARIPQAEHLLRYPGSSTGRICSAWVVALLAGRQRGYTSPDGRGPDGRLR
uniref:Uncharacterized protein n=1 Tax=Burkholderia sp. M701 TaxID=326454 RepID=V5YMN3_9BURK|nr:hypothetical protein [Burkholderia sp. M701]